MKALLKIFILISTLAVSVGCTTNNQNDKPIVLSTDFTEIEPDSDQKVTFTVKKSIENITSSCTIYNKESDQPLDSYTFSSSQEGDFTFYATDGTNVSNEVTITVRENPLENIEIFLIPDGDTIIADNQERVSFKVLCNEQDISSQSELYYVNNGSGYDTRLMEFIFATDIIGTHQFYAVYEGVSSELVSVYAKEIPPRIVLSADKYTILYDGADAATLSVTVNDEDATESAKFYLIISEGEEPVELESNIFTWKQEGTYQIYATVPQGNSNTIEITVQPPAPPAE